VSGNCTSLWAVRASLRAEGGGGGGAKGRICFPLPESQYLTLSLKLVNIKDLVYKSCVDLCKFIVLSTVVALAVRKSVKQLV